MSQIVIKAGLIIAAIINLLPLVGVLSREQLEKLYALPITDPNLEVLMRHRAVLFGIVGGLLITSVFQAEWQTPAIIAGLLSMISFIVLTVMVEGYTGVYRPIIIADVIGIVALCVVCVLKFT